MSIASPIRGVPVECKRRKYRKRHRYYRIEPYRLQLQVGGDREICENREESHDAYLKAPLGYQFAPKEYEQPEGSNEYYPKDHEPKQRPAKISKYAHPYQDYRARRNKRNKVLPPEMLVEEDGHGKGKPYDRKERLDVEA